MEVVATICSAGLRQANQRKASSWMFTQRTARGSPGHKRLKAMFSMTINSIEPAPLILYHFSHIWGFCISILDSSFPCFSSLSRDARPLYLISLAKWLKWIPSPRILQRHSLGQNPCLLTTPALRQVGHGQHQAIWRIKKSNTTLT